MSSKRMAISALLSNDSSSSPQSSSPAPAPSEDEPPLKRQRQHHSYTQQYYDSYNAYPYSPRPSSSPTARYYPPSQPQQQPQSPRGPSPRHPWPPQRLPTPHTQPLPHPQWDDGLRYISPISVTTPAAFDVPQPHRHSSDLRGLGDDTVNAPRDPRFHPSSLGKGQSIAGVLTDQMRAPQTHTALPVPPQLRRDAQHSHVTYVPPAVMDSQSPPPPRTRDISPLAVKISTPRTTPPDLSPRSSYTPQYVSPTASYTTQSASPTPYSPHNSMHSRQNPSIPYTSNAKISPATAYPPSQHSPRIQYASTVSPSTSQAPHFSRVSPSTSYPSTSGSPTASYTPSSFRHPSYPPASRDPGISPVSERPRSPPAPAPPDPAPPTRTPPGAAPSATVDPLTGAAAPSASAPSTSAPSTSAPSAPTPSIPAPSDLTPFAPPLSAPPSAPSPSAPPPSALAPSAPTPSASASSALAPLAPSPPAPVSPTAVPSVPPPNPPAIMHQPTSQVLPLKLSPPDVKRVNEERSFEDELLSLVDGEDLKPKISRPVPQSPPTEPPSVPSGRKSSNLPSKPAAKPKPPPKARAPAKSSKAKTAAKQVSGTPATMLPPSPLPTKQQPAVARAKGKVTATKKKGAAASAARSRSLSLKPAELTPTPAPELDMIRDDDRLYCVCRTSYDEDKIMIACDRCDEWYHPACVGMPEVEVDLVDQYICKQCGTQKVGLQTTYKRRCYRGLKYIASHDTLPTCWKPARGAFSKYCSDDCGMAHMRAKILQSGRDAASLWPAVKNARRREGVTVANGPVKMEEPGEDMDMDMDMERKKAALAEARKALKEADERELAELLRRLDEIMSAREACKAALECVVVRRRLLDLAVDRATGRCCGWDVRLEMNDEELIGWATTEAGRRVLDNKEGESEEQCWCQGPEKCPRHNGWQNIRDMDVQGEVDSKNSSIKQLTDRERELRRRIEDINPPSAPTRQQHGRSGGKKKNQGKKSTRS